jgi:F0F1-type ATP synthase delta subunit
MNVRDYSTAVLELVTEGKDESNILQSLLRMLKSRGHESLYPKILRELTQKLERKESKRGVIVTLARPDDETRLKDQIKEALTELNATDYTTSIDPSITGGFIAQGEEKRIDASYKKSLLTLYRSLIS